ncbi:MAG: methionine adenosyltransferase [Bacteroidales bacterium]|nr:methionine adenosyltransferase [Bacteroidales bacterium]
MGYYFTSESVSEGHPDKVADQISDALVDAFLAFDTNSKVACETLVTTGQVIVSGEVKSHTYVDIQEIVRRVIQRIGYTKSEYRFDCDSCGILSAIHEQSGDINRGVERKDAMEQGAGDQGMMFGYACRETDEYMPLALELSHLILQELAAIRHEGKEMTYLRPDSKSQITLEYSEDHQPQRIHAIVVSTQHDDFVKPNDNTPEAIEKADTEMLNKIRRDVEQILLPRVKKQLPERLHHFFDGNYELFVNPTGKFVIGGPYGDTGLTGRKIIVDTYGGKGAHGGGAFSGKDPSKVDRSAAYAARHIAKNMVAAGVADEMLIQISYAIGVAKPLGVFVNTYGTAKINKPDSYIAETIQKIFDLRPKALEERLQLRHPIYEETATYGHFGRTPRKVTKSFINRSNSEIKPETIEVELFTWEKLDYVEKIREAFGM